MFDLIKNVVFSPWIWGVLALVVGVGMLNKEQGAAAKVSGAVMTVLGKLGTAWQTIIFRLPAIGAVLRHLVHASEKGRQPDESDSEYKARVEKRSKEFLGDQWVQDRMEKWYSNHPDLLLQGTWKSRKELAQTRYPASKFPSLWVPKIPDDLKRSLVSDGRLITGEPLSKIAETGLSRQHQGLAVRSAAAAILVWFSLIFIVWQPTLFLESANTASLASTSSDVSKVAGSESMIGRTLDRDYWSSDEYQKAVSVRRDELVGGRGNSRPFAIAVVESVLDPTRILFAVAFSLMMGMAAFRGLFSSVLSEVGKKVHDGTKEQTVRWKHRLEQRNMEYSAYCEQLNVVKTFDLSPTIKLGKATGIYRFRGRLDAPYKGSQIQMSLVDLKQNMLIIGGTGQGKTRTVIKPLLDQLLEIRRIQRGKAQALRVSRGMDAAIPARFAKSAKSSMEFEWPYGVSPNLDMYEQIDYPLDISTYMTDGKAVFYHDMKEIATKLGLEDDLLILGVNAAAGEASVDLLDNIAPQLVADIIRSVARQSGGGKNGDDFWPDMAAEVIRNCAVVARVFDFLPEGLAWVDEHKGERPYSLVFIYELAMDPGGLLKRILIAMDKAQKDPDLFPLIREFYNSELLDAARYLTETWLPMVSQTRDGIKANIVNILGGFGANAVLRGSFAGGAGDNQVSADQFWGRLCVTNLDSLEFGVSGRIINVFLKILFMTEAARREKQTKAERSKIEKEFFALFPKFSVKDVSMEQIGQKIVDVNSYPDDMRALYEPWRASGEAAAAALNDFLVSVSEDIPLAAGVEAFVQKADDRARKFYGREDLARQAAAISTVCNAFYKASAEFRDAYPEICSKRVFLSDGDWEDRDNPAESKIAKMAERIRSDRDIVRYAVKASAATGRELANTDAVVRRAHELYYQWRVVNTRLDGSGEGAIREQMFFIADEYQTLITVDLKEGAMSDSSFPNISRSTGTSLIVATQSMAALKQAVGDVSADNFCHQMRSKIFLQVEDPATTEYIKKVSGKAMRSYVFDNDAYESYDAMAMEREDSFVDPFIHGIKPETIYENNPLARGAMSAAAGMVVDMVSPLSANDAVRKSQFQEPDTRNVPKLRRVRNAHGHMETNEDQVAGAMQQAVWRSVDLKHKTMAEGNQDMEVFRDDDFTIMGRNHAYMLVQRAGKTKQDFVFIGNEFGNWEDK